MYRHQAYVVGNIGNEQAIIGISHQHLTGAQSIIYAARYWHLITEPQPWAGLFFGPPKSKEAFDGYSEALYVNYTAIPEMGWYMPLRRAPKFGLKDPRLESNQTGITIFDIREPTEPRYCFMAIQTLERTFIGDINKAHIAYQLPLSAECWIRAFSDPKTPASENALNQFCLARVMKPRDCHEIFPQMYDGVDLRRRERAIKSRR